MWGMTGNIETTADGVAFVENGQARINVSDTGKGEIESGMTLRIGGKEYIVSSVETDSYGRTTAYAPVSEADGRYDVNIVIESIHPIIFLFE